MEKKPPRWSAEEVPTAAVAQGGGGVAGVGFERGGPGGGGPQRGPRGDLLCTLSESGRVPAETWREASHVVLAMFAGPIRPR